MYQHHAVGYNRRLPRPQPEAPGPAPLYAALPSRRQHGPAADTSPPYLSPGPIVFNQDYSAHAHGTRVRPRKAVARVSIAVSSIPITHAAVGCSDHLRTPLLTLRSVVAAVNGRSGVRASLRMVAGAVGAGTTMFTSKTASSTGYPKLH